MKIRFPYGTTAENNQLLLPEGEISVDIERKALRLHDGVTQGGFEMLGTKALVPPGPKDFIGGNSTAGFYGEVPTNQFISGDDLADAVGLTAGISQYSTEPWLKFSLGGKILFIAKKPYRHTISGAQLQAANVITGDQTIKIGLLDYKVRLPSGSSTNPVTDQTNTYDGAHTHGSEWNRLMYHISGQPFADANNTLASEGIIEGDWAQYLESDLILHSSNGNGHRTLCSNLTTNDAYVFRGHGGVSFTSLSPYSFAGAVNGWRPVLELVED